MNFFSSPNPPNVGAEATPGSVPSPSYFSRQLQKFFGLDQPTFLRLLLALLYQLSLFSSLILAPLSSIPATLSALKIGVKPTLLFQIIGLLICIALVGNNADILCAYFLMTLVPAWIWTPLIKSKFTLFQSFWIAVALQLSVSVAVLHLAYPEVRQKGLITFSAEALEKSIHQVDQMIFKNPDPGVLEESKITEFFNEFRVNPKQFTHELNYKILALFVQAQVLLLWLLVMFLNQTNFLPEGSAFSRAQYIRFKLPESYVWIIVACGVAYYCVQFQIFPVATTSLIPDLGVGLLTGLEVFLSVYFLQGMAVWTFFGSHFPEARAFKLSMIVFGVLFFQIMVIATAVLGLSDLWLDFRKRIKLIRIPQDRE